MRLWPRRRVYVDDLPRTHDLRFGSLFVLGFMVLLGGLYVLGHLAAGDRLPVGTKVAGIDVGGMRPGLASTTLQDALAPRLERRIDVTVAGHTFSVDPQRAGMTFDLQATIRAGLDGSSWDPRHMLHVLAGGDSLSPVLDVDRHELSATLRHIAAATDRRAVDASVSFATGAPRLAYAQEGRTLDLARSAARLEGALIAGDDSISLPLDNVDPVVSSSAGARFISTVVRPAIAAPVSIRVADKHLVLRPRLYLASLRTVSRGGRLRLTIDPAQLYARTSHLITALPYHPANARISFQGGRPRVVASRSGVAVDPADWARAVLKAAGRTGSARHAPTRIHPDPPPFTTADARMLGLRVPVAAASATVATSDQASVDRTVNQLDGTLVRPGGRFSFLGTVGDGDSTVESVVAGAVYQAAMSAGMADIQRTGAPVHPSGVADGMDALVQAPSSDLTWQNTTPFGVYLHVFAGQLGGGRSVIHVELWSSPYWTVDIATSSRYHVTRPTVQRISAPGCTPRRGVPGFDVDVTRTSGHLGQPRRVETFHSSYSPVDAVVCRGRGLA